MDHYIPYIKRKIILKAGESSERKEDYIAVEKKLNITLNEKCIISLFCTPSQIKELITGLLFTGGISDGEISPDILNISYGDEINVDIAAKNIPMKNLNVSRHLGGFTFTKDRISKPITDRLSVSFKVIKGLFDKFQQKSELFRLTGCFHSAALADTEKILAFAEDIGRHNAVDKVIGSILLQDIPFFEKIMLVSCRLSSEIVLKCSHLNISILASRAAPTDLAIKIAEESRITLIGFMRDNRFNIYTHNHRVIL
ncbi:MAG: formate dehydrogenase accessory sulfurtransferase FdhD [Nitrospirae bacterium]|nr:formate dehydrogenase accessory sulfurtransferase FdhD [Nitrospirota bacterium]